MDATVLLFPISGLMVLVIFEKHSEGSIYCDFIHIFYPVKAIMLLRHYTERKTMLFR